MSVSEIFWQATRSPDRYVGCMESPFTGMRKSAPSKEGTTYRSHSYSMTDISEVKAPAIALRGIRGMPFWLPCGSLRMPNGETDAEEGAVGCDGG